MKTTHKSIYSATIIIILLAISGSIHAYAKMRSYTKKSAYSDFGKSSKVNRLPKTKAIAGHGKRTRKGYTYVNPYARSK